MNQKQMKKQFYKAPRCKIIQTENESFICTSTRLDAGGSSTDNNWRPEEEYNGGTIYFGTKTTVAPAKDAWFEEEEEY